jgi:hypothetical protein
MFETDSSEWRDWGAGPGMGAPVAAAPAPSAAVQQLVDALDLLAAQDPAELPAAQALADAEALLRQRERLHALSLRRIGDVDARGLHALAGSPSTSTWMAQQQSSLDRGQVALARRLAGLPTLEAAVTSGSVSVETAERVGRALARLRRHVDRPDGLIDGQDGEQALLGVIVDGVRSEVFRGLGSLPDDDPRVEALVDELTEVAGRPVPQLARLEAAFVLLARHVEPVILPSALGTLVDALLPNDLERRAEDGERARGFGISVKPDGSGWRVSSGDLDLECGELLNTVLQAEMATDPDNPADTAGYERLRAEGWEAGDELPAGHGPRSLRQRRHDALKAGLRRLLDSGALGLRDKVAPHVSVTIGLDALHAAPGALPGVTASGTRIPLSLVRRWWCDSRATRFVLGLGGRVLEMSHTERTLKAHERRAKHVETGGRCQGAGCRCGPGAQLVPHHVDAYAACGTTSIAETVMCCEQTHRDVHSGGRTIRLKDGRWLSAAGWVDGPGLWERAGP